MAGAARFKIASERWEFDQISRLNHRTFAREIPQHAPRADQTLVDRFHEQNTYVIAVDSGQVIAMLAIRAHRPFSLDAKLPRLDDYLPPATRPCELRLLAIEPHRRGSRVALGLFRRATEHCLDQGFDLAVISATLRQLHLYRHLGFVEFGPVVGTREAPFQPMYLDADGFRTRAATILPRPRSIEVLNFLPGPVAVSEAVRAAYARPPVSHRGREFTKDFEQAGRRLCAMTGALHVQILAGSGTLANDALAAQLSLRRRTGLIIAQGEFGERLIDHAQRFGVPGEALRIPWGQRLDPGQLEAALSKSQSIQWLWTTHCETSSGVLNDLEMLKSICRRKGIDLCLDCIGSIGTVPLDLRGVHLASASSGKGLAAYAGLAMVFHDSPVQASPRLPRSIDLGLYAQFSVPYTIPSGPLAALLAALDEQTAERYRAMAVGGARLREGLARQGWRPVAEESTASPAVITVTLPAARRSMRLGRQLEGAGILAAFRSRHLRERNAIQFCLMGHATTRKIDALLGILASMTTG